MRLSGWRRIGIVLSVLWLLGSFAGAFDGYDFWDWRSQASITSFLGETNSVEQNDDLNSMSDEQLAAIAGVQLKASFSERMFDFLFKIVFVPIFWFSIELTARVIRWIRRGFSE